MVAVTQRVSRRSVWGAIAALIVGALASVAVLSLASSVAREMQVLRTANSDNVQWTLSQIEVEYLEFQTQIKGPETDLATLRQRYDVFFSRLNTVARASVFENLRQEVDFERQLTRLQSFLDESVPLIDAGDDGLRSALPELAQMASAARPHVRRLSVSGLKYFAEAGDAQRGQILSAMIKLAVALSLLIGLLALAIVYLTRLYRKTTAREQELAHTATRMNTIIRTSLDAVIVSNHDGVIQQFNAAAESIFGHNAEDVLGRDIGAVIVPDHLRDAHDAGMQRMREKGEKRVVGKGRVQLEAKHADGSTFPVELAIQSADTGTDEIFIAFLRDISNRVAAEKALVDARDKALNSEKLKTDFLATMSHEIRTPLNGLLGNMALLRDTSLNHKQDQCLRDMETSGRLLMSHISDVLDITRYDAGKLTIELAPMNIAVLVQDIVDSQSATANANETSLDWGWKGPALNWVVSDRDRVQHVLMNLIGNAVKFTKRGRVSITLEAQEADSDQPQLQIEITDTGVGMDEDLVARIFDDFVTGNTAHDRDVGGTGLGLGIAKRFTAALGGTVDVRSTLGEGSTFRVSLPITKATAPEKESAQPKPVLPEARLNILVVEDNEINRVVLRKMLEADGHEVHVANDGAEGTRLAALTKYDLVLMDISMPIMDGHTATRHIRAGDGLSAKTPIVALTANAMLEEQDSFAASGMAGVLTKPLSRDALRQMLDSIHRDTLVVPKAAIDREHAAQTRNAVGEVAYAKLIAKWTQEVETLLEWLEDAHAKDRSDIAKAAHKAASSAAVFGAVDLSHELKQIENTAKRGEDAACMAHIDNLSGVWTRTKAAAFEAN